MPLALYLCRNFKGKMYIMKNSWKAGLLLLAIVALACNPIKFIQKKLDEIQVVAKPEKLEVHGNTVQYSLKGKFPAKVFHKKAYITLTPILTYNGGELELPSKEYRGEKTEGTAQVINFKSGGAFALEGSFDFDDKMAGKDAKLYLKVKVCKGPSECAEFKKENLAVGVINTSKMVMTDEKVFFGGDLESPIKMNFTRSIFFTINSWNIRSSEKSSDRMAELKKFVVVPNLDLKGISINSYASPDGELKINQNLTQRRSDATYSYLTREMKKLKVNVSGGDLYKKQSLEEDWKGFRELAQNSNLSDKQKLLQIIDSKQSNDDKEKAVKALDSWPTILAEMMPKLRRSDMILSGNIINRKMEDLIKLAENGFNDFTTKELLIYANSINDDAKKIKAYEAYITKRPKSYIGYNNLAAVYILKSNYNQAKNYLDQGAEKANDNDSLYNNYGIVYRYFGDLDKALECYDRAARAGIATGYNKGIVNIMQGNYAEAVANIPTEVCGINAGLAQLLNGNYTDAISKLDCAKNLTAKLHYLKAIANARQGKVDNMAASLRKAVELDKSFATKATNDLEFNSYWERDEFKNAINR